MSQQQIKKQLRLVGRPIGIGKARLGREGVGFQPLQQLGAITGHHRQLRHVHVGVDQAGDDQAVRPLLDLGFHWQSRQQLAGGVESQHTPLGNYQQAVSVIFMGARVGRVQARLLEKVQQRAAKSGAADREGRRSNVGVWHQLPR